MNTGNIFVISAPSGAGKSSLVKALCESDSQIKVCISHTTRKIRANEKDGVNYFFINLAEFEHMLKDKQFVEHALVYGNYYGTHIATIQKLQKSGQDIILEIDYQGAMQIRKLFPQSTLIYILPPSLKELRNRLLVRNTDNADIISRRLNLAKEDISHAVEFDYAVINDNFDTALHNLYSIILVQRLRAEKVLCNYNFL